MIPLLDASSPGPTKGTANPAVSPSFSPPANSMLFALCQADELNTFVVSNTGTALTWTSIGASVNQSGQGGMMVFWAWNATAQTNITVSSTRTGSFTAHALYVLVCTQTESAFTGAKLAGTGATVNLVTTGPDSWVWASHVDESGSIDTAAASCTFHYAETVFGGISGGVLKRTATTPVAGTSVTIGVLVASTLLAFEVKGAPDSVPSLRFRAPGLTPFGLPQPWQGTGSDTTTGPVSRLVSDGAAASDTAARDAQAFTRAAVDTAAASDVVARSQTVSRAVADTAGAADVTTRALVLARSAGDSTVAVDVVTRSGLTFTRTASDTSGASDTVVRTVTEPRAAADTAVDVDAVIRSQSAARPVVDTAPASDAATRQYSVTRAVADTAAATDTVSRSSQALSRTAADNVFASDAVALGNGVRAVSDAAAASDSAARSVSFARAVSDGGGGSDTAKASRSYARTAIDIVGGSDTVTRGSITLIRVITDTSTASDTVAVSRSLVRVCADAASSADAATCRVAVSLHVVDTAFAVDSAALSSDRRDITVYVRVADSKWRATSIPLSRWTADPQPSRWNT